MTRGAYVPFGQYDRDGMRRRWEPRLDREPSAILEMQSNRRRMCRCTECGGPMPHHTPDMICASCGIQIERELAAMGFAPGPTTGVPTR